MRRSTKQFLCFLVLAGCLGGAPAAPVDHRFHQISEEPTPSTLESAVTTLRRSLPASDLEEIGKLTVDGVIALNGDFGRGLRNLWLNPPGSPLEAYFKRSGLDDPENMTASAIILEALWRDLRDQPWNPDRLIETNLRWRRANVPPEISACPDESGERARLIYVLSLPGQNPFLDKRISSLQCLPSGAIWMFEDGGWRKPTAAESKEAREAIRRRRD